VTASERGSADAAEPVIARRTADGALAAIEAMRIPDRRAGRSRGACAR